MCIRDRRKVQFWNPVTLCLLVADRRGHQVGAAYVSTARRNSRNIVSLVRTARQLFRESIGDSLALTPRALSRVAVTWALKFRRRSSRTPRYFTVSVQLMGLPSKERDWHREMDLRVKQIASDFSVLIATRHFLSQSGSIVIWCCNITLVRQGDTS